MANDRDLVFAVVQRCWAISLVARNGLLIVPELDGIESALALVFLKPFWPVGALFCCRTTFLTINFLADAQIADLSIHFLIVGVDLVVHREYSKGLHYRFAPFLSEDHKASESNLIFICDPLLGEIAIGKLLFNIFIGCQYELSAQ